ncbi:DUF4124 domain-containing protein [Shewanella yunxiaonensis]|uniref:DUF4124 domain-containing protein n=1 Tax=Shewanella yunxiaonensis TaxID=2829809 RepID=A0ABX7YSI2_9GAMM|nr:DUF4124 domain-containing protein [Shewanella yunxiaonensis]QUN05739.1 DUF4124 domain-containing protein [Shewanella yunxiaonensis]
MRVLLMLLCLLSVTAQATVYKWIDKDGNIHFSDQPHANAQQVKLPDNTGNQVTMTPVNAISNEEPTTAAEQKALYQVSIVSPHHEATIRDNAGDFTVTGNVQPELASGHYLQLFIDGVATSDAQASPVFQLKNIDRGEHKLQLKVEQQNGKVLASSSEITIFLHQAGLIKPAIPAPSAKRVNG